jgi:hypothetical protein
MALYMLHYIVSLILDEPCAISHAWSRHAGLLSRKELIICYLCMRSNLLLDEGEDMLVAGDDEHYIGAYDATPSSCRFQAPNRHRPQAARRL